MTTPSRITDDPIGEPAATAGPGGPAATAGPGEPAATAGTGLSGGRAGRWITGDTLAVLSWLAVAPVAFYLPTRMDRNPFATGATVLPLAVAFCLIAAGLTAVAVIGDRDRADRADRADRVDRADPRGGPRSGRAGDRIAGIAAGLAASWIVLMLRLALAGTPFGFGGLVGDMGRTTASATRYTTTVASSDTLIPTLPSEYPPLYTWLVGRAAVLLDLPAWRLLADAEVLFMSAALLVGFLLWRRLTPGWVALTISALTMVTWSDPRKAYEVLTLVIFVPWALEVFARPPRARMHWLAAGLLGGFIAVTYQAWLVYAAPGLLALAMITWRAESDRRGYLRRLGLIGLVTFTAASWYVVPFLHAMVTRGGQQVSDRYVSASISEGWFPFLNGSPLGLAQLVGLAGLIWLWRERWWARPLLLIIVGVYAYRLIAMIRYVMTGHTGFLHYTGRLYAVVFTVAGVLVLTQLTPMILRRFRLTSPPLAGPVVAAVAIGWAAATFTMAWMPEHGNRHAISAHTEPLPDGGHPRYAPAEGRRGWFPVTPVRRAVEGELGPDPRRVTLSVDDRLFSYLPWPGYLDNDRTAGSTLSRWDERYAEVRRLSTITDPARFTTASATTRFGPIDILVLRAGPAGWQWRASQRFRPEQFAAADWTVLRDLPGDIVVVIRR